MRLLFIFQTICLLYCLSSTAYAETTRLEKAQIAFDNGQFEQAIYRWQKAQAENKMSAKTIIDIKIKLASAYKKLGFYQNAFDLLQESLAATTENDQVQQALIWSAIGDLYLSGYQDKNYRKEKKTNLKITLNKKAKDCFNKAIEIAHKTTDKLLLAKVLNKQGNFLLIQGHSRQAIDNYKKSEQLAREVGDLSLVSKAFINMAHAMLVEDGIKEAVIQKFMKALNATQKLEASHDKSFGLMALSNMISKRAKKTKKFISKSAMRGFQHTALKSAQKSADKTQDIVAQSYAYGYMGKLYEDEKRYNEALQLTRKALFFAQLKALPELLYRWYWQEGRILKAQSQQDKAIKMYQFAIKSIRKGNIKDCKRSIIPRLLQTGYRDRSEEEFYDTVGKLYFELADLLIKNNTENTSQDEKLTKVLDVVEDFKIVEFQHYFRDDCIEEKKPINDKFINKFELLPKTAILYPILLPNRIELLLKLPKKWHESLKIRTVPGVSEQEVNQLASSFAKKTE